VSTYCERISPNSRHRGIAPAALSSAHAVPDHEQATIRAASCAHADRRTYLLRGAPAERTNSLSGVAFPDLKPTCTDRAQHTITARKEGTTVNKRLLSIRELADLLGVSVATIRWWLHEGTAPPVIKLGRHNKFDPDDVDRWIDARRRAPAATQPEPTQAGR
jgi:excisionase family DNA binding protein